MKVVYSRCAGLDVHKKSIHACVRVSRGAERVAVETAVFSTFASDLERLRKWLRDRKVRRVVMESTGVYWVPIWNVLEDSQYRFNLVLVNPQHVKALPGRKTDQQDCERLAELGQFDLVRASFVPPKPIRQLREMTRRRVHLQGDRNRVINRIGRLLETANLKLSSVASNIVGKTGKLILEALVRGEHRAEWLAELAQGHLRKKKEQLAEALEGRMDAHFRWNLHELLDDLGYLDKKLAALDERIREAIQPHADLVRRLCTIPGVSEITAWTLIAELGTDMSVFPTAAQAASWAGLCPGMKESAGKRQSGRTRKGDRYLRRALIQNAWAVAHKKDCFLTALFHRVAYRRGMKRAAMAVAHRVLVIAYYVIRDGTVYRELGGDFYDQINPQRTAEKLTRRLEQIGYNVVLTKAPEQPVLAPSKKRGRPRKYPVGYRPTKTLSFRPKREDAATPEQCSMCARWGIACIHARNRLNAAPTTQHHVESEA